ncbi:hypothetical protein QTN25_007543 [Entamoeba marina]
MRPNSRHSRSPYHSSCINDDYNESDYGRHSSPSRYSRSPVRRENNRDRFGKSYKRNYSPHREPYRRRDRSEERSSRGSSLERDYDRERRYDDRRNFHRDDRYRRRNDDHYRRKYSVRSEKIFGSEEKRIIKESSDYRELVDDSNEIEFNRNSICRDQQFGSQHRRQQYEKDRIGDCNSHEDHKAQFPSAECVKEHSTFISNPPDLTKLSLPSYGGNIISVENINIQDNITSAHDIFQDNFSEPQKINWDVLINENKRIMYAIHLIEKKFFFYIPPNSLFVKVVLELLSKHLSFEEFNREMEELMQFACKEECQKLWKTLMYLSTRSD